MARAMTVLCQYSSCPGLCPSTHTPRRPGTGLITQSVSCVTWDTQELDENYTAFLLPFSSTEKDKKIRQKWFFNCPHCDQRHRRGIDLGKSYKRQRPIRQAEVVTLLTRLKCPYCRANITNQCIPTAHTHAMHKIGVDWGWLLTISFLFCFSCFFIREMPNHWQS